MRSLYWGDNLSVLRESVPDDSVDLIYLDPPFNSNRNYNVLFRENSTAESDAQIQAFTDTWHWGPQAALAFDELIYDNRVPQRVSDLIRAMHSFIGENDVMAYLVMMTLRLLELHRVLKSTGSIYLHCDPTASHYLKVVMDTIWGPRNFRNEIIWKRTPFAGSSKSRAIQYPRNHDILLFYTKSDARTWNRPTVPYTPEYLKRFKWIDERGAYRKTLLKTYSKETLERLKRENRLIEPVRKGAMYSYKQYLHESSGNRQVDDVWTDINMLNPVSKERLGYPTQKPEALLERIIQSSSNPGDVVLDPFCGCGTAISVAERLNRNWIGIDITHLAITAIRYRLESAFPDIEVNLDGIPKDLGGAQLLAETDRYGFQHWALSLVIAKPAATDSTGKAKRGADKGIDGYISFVTSTPRLAGTCIVQVKSGHVTAAMVRDLRGTIERDNADAGLFITLDEPTTPMQAESLQAGFFESDFTQQRHPRMQILTIRELLNGAKPDLPPRYNPFQLSTARQRGTVKQPDLFGSTRATGN